MAIEIPTYPHAGFSLRDDGVGTLEIRDAGKLNILSAAVVESLISMLSHIDRRDDVKVLDLRAEQEKAFVAGSDIQEMAFLDHARAIASIEPLRQLDTGATLRTE